MQPVEWSNEVFEQWAYLIFKTSFYEKYKLIPKSIKCLRVSKIPLKDCFLKPQSLKFKNPIYIISENSKTLNLKTRCDIMGSISCVGEKWRIFKRQKFTQQLMVCKSCMKLGIVCQNRIFRYILHSAICVKFFMHFSNFQQISSLIQVFKFGLFFL